MIAVTTFRNLWERKKYILFTDNASCVANIKKGYASNNLANKIIRELYQQQIYFSFSLRVDYISSLNNKLAGMLSRDQFKSFTKINPNMNFISSQIPLFLTHLISSIPSITL